ncbi:MAG TPA: hypothetical protein PLL99_04945 [Chitinophagales bacterium]|jgi:hypothetical protein|nr:hypothetical protein [Chitinophagales bacterium]
MKKIILLALPVLLIALVFSNCNRKANAASKNTSDNKRTATLTTMTKNGITLTELYSPETFDNATLEQALSTNTEDLDSNKFTLTFKTNNYTLGTQTSMTDIKTCANSAQGQHIHCIIDNEPYSALYNSTAKLNAMKDGQHTVLTFLSRSYHESIKNKNAFSLTSVITGTSRYTARYAQPDFSKPMLFYSRPKGTYTGIETDAVLLDFYLVNCDLSKDGYKVKANINGNEFILNKWCGYFMEGLPIGETNIKLTLLDKNGKQVDSPYSYSERKITLKK